MSWGRTELRCMAAWFNKKLLKGKQHTNNELSDDKITDLNMLKEKLVEPQYLCSLVFQETIL